MVWGVCVAVGASFFRSVSKIANMCPKKLGRILPSDKVYLCHTTTCKVVLVFFLTKTAQHSQQTDAQCHLLVLLRTTKTDKRQEDNISILTIWLNLQ